MQAFARRAVSGFGVVLGVVTLMFALLRLAPGDPALLLVGPTATAEQVTAQRHALGLDRPLPAQYAAWLGRFARGDWGTSIATGRPVRAMLAQAWPATVRLVGLSLVLSYLIGIAVGAIQAARNGRLDTALSIATVTLFALPGYWLGLMLVMVFTYRLRWLPAFGAAGFDADFLSPAGRLADRLRHLTLPLATLTLVGVGGTARFVRGAMLDVAGAPFVTVARAKGLSERRVTLRHVLRNALIPVLTVTSLQVGFLLVGTVLVEYTLGLGGLGSLITDSIQNRDYPVIQGTVLFLTVAFVLINLVTDLLYAWIDPRVSLD